MMTTQKSGGLVTVCAVEENDQIILVTDHGRLIRCPVNQIKIARRRTQGVIIFRVDSDEKVVSVSLINQVEPEPEDEEESVSTSS